MTPQEALRAVLDLANRIEALAFEMKAPNAYTPQFVMLANEVRALRAALAAEQEPPCKTGSQCVGGKCERCAVQEPWGYISHRSWKMPVFVEAGDLEVSGLPFNNPDYTPVYKDPPQREWQGLTEVERIDIIDEEITAQNTEHFALAQAIEAKLKEKNHGC